MGRIFRNVEFFFVIFLLFFFFFVFLFSYYIFYIAQSRISQKVRGKVDKLNYKPAWPQFQVFKKKKVCMLYKPQHCSYVIYRTQEVTFAVQSTSHRRHTDPGCGEQARAKSVLQPLAALRWNLQCHWRCLQFGRLRGQKVCPWRKVRAHSGSLRARVACEIWRKLIWP